MHKSKALASQVCEIKSKISALVHKSKVVGDLKIGCFGFMQLLDWTHPWAPRGQGSLGKILRFQVCYIKTRNQASVHKSYVVGDLSIAVILKLREGMHFSRSKNARLLNWEYA